MEYKEFAKYYDIFYSKKDYKKEVDFIKNFLNKDDKILDIGCGTGIHASYLESDGYIVDGLDLNKEMLSVAKNRLNGTLYNQNMLNIKIDRKYDVIISMFAVINHLKNINELEMTFKNIKNILNENGVIIIDLHNPINSGTKTNVYNNLKRTMTWNYDKENKIEITNINFMVDDVYYKDTHIFKIFTIEEIKKCAKKIGLKVVNIHENYNIDKVGNEDSKNLQFIIKKKTH